MSPEAGSSPQDERDKSAVESALEDPVVRWTTHPAMVWFIRNVVSHLDPLIFRASKGRWTFFGAPTMPMVTIDSVGRKSGKTRSVHLACIPYGGEFYVVASAMGQQKHPGWAYNLEAHPEVEVQMDRERFRVRAERLGEAEREEVWGKIREAIPQVYVYEQRTQRKIRVFRLQRITT